MNSFIFCAFFNLHLAYQRDEEENEVNNVPNDVEDFQEFDELSPSKHLYPKRAVNAKFTYL